MAIKELIGNGIGFSPGNIGYVITRGLGNLGVVADLVPELRSQANAFLCGNEGRYSANPSALDATVTDTFHIYNNGDPFTFDYAAFAISGDGTLVSFKESNGTDVTGDEVLGNGDWLVVAVSRDTSAKGAKLYRVSGSLNGGDVSVTFDIHFDVGLGGFGSHLLIMED